VIRTSISSMTDVGAAAPRNRIVRLRLPSPERATKLLVLVSACMWLAGDLILVSREWSMLPAAAVIFAASFALAAWDRHTVALTLAFTYLFPAVIRLAHGRYVVQYGILWMAALLGALLPDAARTPWHIPARWRGPLVCWALVLVVGVPLVVWREVDFYPALLTGGVPNPILSGFPAGVVAWTLHVALVLALGMLWFDWLFGARDLDFHKVVATPLAASFLVTALVACIQLFVDVTFLNERRYGALARASGTFYDANVSGTIAAMWIGGSILWGVRTGRWRGLLVLSGAVLAWLAVWASASRTAFAAAAIVTASALVALYKSVRNPRLRIVGLLAWTAMLIGVVAVLANSSLETSSPLRRLWGTVPAWSIDGARQAGFELWNRNGYGAASTSTFREYPLFGVGVGFLYVVITDFIGLPPDNAQNWYRHQLAEFGVIGSAGWIVWVVAFAAFVLRRHRGSPIVAYVGRGMLVAFAVISLLGMPGQDLSVAITFWTMAFWYVALVGRSQDAGDPKPIGRRTWAMILLVVTAHGAGTAVLATTALRPPVRALRMGWPYSYGFYAPEPDEAGGEFRWAARRAEAMVAAPRPWMVLAVWVNHRDVATNPVDVKVWCNGVLEIETRLTSPEPVTRYIRIDSHQTGGALIQTSVSRTIRPSDLGVNDSRELGLMVKWGFRDLPPPAAADAFR
jgi:hypothetical protein